MELHWAGDTETDAVRAAEGLFDHRVRSDWVERFVTEGNHHLCLAYADTGEPAGFVSGVEVTHPDKGTEMFLYELAVDERFRRRGIGRALVEALLERAGTLGCYGMWVLAETGDEPALTTYLSAGADDRSDAVMLTWRLDPAHVTFADGASPE